MPYKTISNPEVQPHLLEKPVVVPNLDELLHKLDASKQGEHIENVKAGLQAFNYIKVAKRYIPYQKDPDSIDHRFPENFKTVEPN
jgi:hypothetical protein